MMLINGIKLLELEEVSKILDTTRQTLYTYLNSGKLKGQMIKGKWRVTEENLNKFIRGE